MSNQARLEKTNRIEESGIASLYRANDRRIASIVNEAVVSKGVVVVDIHGWTYWGLQEQGRQAFLQSLLWIFDEIERLPKAYKFRLTGIDELPENLQKVVEREILRRGAPLANRIVQRVPEGVVVAKLVPVNLVEGDYVSLAPNEIVIPVNSFDGDSLPNVPLYLRAGAMASAFYTQYGRVPQKSDAEYDSMIKALEASPLYRVFKTFAKKRGSIRSASELHQALTAAVKVQRLIDILLRPISPFVFNYVSAVQRSKELAEIMA